MEHENRTAKDIEVSAEMMKGLAHPLRARIFSLLMTKGPATATLLAETLGESSGSTREHRRDVAQYGVIGEDPRDENAKERWWRRVTGSYTVTAPEENDSPAQHAQRTMYFRQW